METKPYNIQSPEDIAKDYGGNKQKIAQAMQMGVVDPTAGVLAGMFIDRMRSAQTQEQAPQLSVAQQVMGGAPPAPPQAGGLGATPPAAAPMAPPGGMGMAPPMEAQGGMGMAPPPAMPQPPMGMAEGGLYEAPYMKDGGLSELPIPDGMFDENRDGAYANGGIVAFSPGGEAEVEEIVVSGSDAPEDYYGFYRDPTLMREQIDELYTPERKQSQRLTEMFETAISPEAQKKRKKEDLWASLAELGFGIASSKSPTLLGAVGEAGMRAAPAMAARGKERRAEQRDAVKTLAQQEGLNNKESLDLARLTMEGTDKYGQFDVKRLDREQQERIVRYQEKMQNARTQMQVSAQIQSAQIGAAGQSAYLEKQDALLRKQVGAAAEAQIPTLMRDVTNPIGKAANAYQMAIKKFGANSDSTARAAAALETAKSNHVNAAINRVSGAFMGGSGFGEPPAGAVVPVGK